MACEIIYEPKGRAAEYANLAASGYFGCNHGCKYCFNPRHLKKKIEVYSKPNVRKDILERFEEECSIMAAKGDRREVFMSFTTDPYNTLEETECITREMIKILIKYELHFVILTKGINPLQDLDLLLTARHLCRFGVSLTLLNEDDRKLWEPNASTATERLNSLECAHRNGLRTWASVEPIIYPDQSIELMKLAAPFCHEFRIGKLNHIEDRFLRDFMDQIRYTPPTEKQLVRFVHQAEEILETHHRKGIFKSDMEPYILKDPELGFI